MGRAKRCSVGLVVVFSVLGLVSCRQHHTKRRPESMPWFPAQFVTPPDQSAFLLTSLRQMYPQQQDSNARLRNSTKGLHVDQSIGIIGRHQTILQASYGPFIVAENVTPQTNVSIDNELNRFTVKTELLTSVLPAHDPTVRVLFRWEKEVDFSNGAADETTGQEPLPCAKLVVFYDGKELSSACRMQGGVLACVAKLPIPPDWWGTMTEADALQAYYSVFQVAENAPCLPNNHNAIPPRDGEPGNTAASPQYFIGEVKMGSSDDTFVINREDHYVWIHSPTAEFGSNAKFQIPVSILSNFTATGCVIRAKARQGLQVVAVHTVDTQEWSISSRVNPKGSLAMVTVLRREEAVVSYDGFPSALDDANRQGSDGTSIAFTVEFTVLNGTDGSRPINWRIDYEEEMHTMQVRTTVEVRPRSTQSIVAITKDGNLVNTAALNGVRVNKPMTVLAASYAGQVLDVTGQAQCSSMDTSVVQVDKHCRRVYVDGTETSGSLSVQIQVSYEGQTTYKMLSLWMPEFPLEVVLDDNKLSIIKGWKVPAESTDRMTRGAEMLDLNEEKKQSSKGKCKLRYQQSGVEVYTRFYAPHANTVPGQTGRKVYLFGEDLRHHITQLVVDQIVADDTSIAVVRNGQVYADGKYAGMSNIKVLSPYGAETLGQTSVIVATDKVTVDELHVNMVTGMSMKIHPSHSERSNVMVAKVRGRHQLFAQYQEIILDGLMTFSDGSSINLQDIRQRDFTPVITSLNPEILSESPLTTSRHPTLVALGEGVTSVMLEVTIPEACHKWKNNNIVVFNLMQQINVSFSEGNHLSEDGQETRRNERLSLTPTIGRVDYGVTLPDFDPNDQGQQGGGGGGKGRNGKKGTNIISSIPIDIDISDLYPRYTNHKADGEFGDDHVDYEDNQLDLNFFNKSEEKLTPLEIGMYVLLGVFCVAILAFMINCVLFMARYRKSKRVPGVGASTYPQNWVLFGPDDHMPTPVASPEEMVPLHDCPAEKSGSPEECTCTESEVSVERHSKEDCGMHAIRGSEGTLPCASRIYGNETCDCCNGVCECEMDTAMHDGKSEDEENSEEDEDRGSVSICSSESRENMEVKNAAVENCNRDSGLDSVLTHTNHLADDCVESDTNTTVLSVAIAPEEPSTSTEATEDLEDPNSELRITLNPTAGVEDCSIGTPQDEIGFSELLDYLSELQETCA